MSHSFLSSCVPLYPRIRSAVQSFSTPTFDVLPFICTYSFACGVHPQMIHAHPMALLLICCCGFRLAYGGLCVSRKSPTHLLRYSESHVVDHRPVSISSQLRSSFFTLVFLLNPLSPLAGGSVWYVFCFTLLPIFPPFPLPPFMTTQSTLSSCPGSTPLTIKYMVGP